MRYVISYDISNNAIRRRIDKVLQDYGQRVQKSVFECNLTSPRIESLITLLEAERRRRGTAPTDSIRIYPLCVDCSRKAIVLGHHPPIATESAYVVI